MLYSTLILLPDDASKSTSVEANTIFTGLMADVLFCLKVSDSFKNNVLH